MAKAVFEPEQPARLALDDGSIFHGSAFGAAGSVSGEIVFHTTVSGYEEVLHDPALAAKLVVFTSPEIGNVGITEPRPARPGATLSGMVVKKVAKAGSNWRLTTELGDWMAKSGVVGIAGIDTRALAHRLRRLAKEGKTSSFAVITSLSSEELSDEELLTQARQGELKPVSPAAQPVFKWVEGSDELLKAPSLPVKPEKERKTPPISVAVLDFGVSWTFLRQMVDSGFEPTLYPSSSSASDILAGGHQGLVLSNGPGDPASLSGEAQLVKALLGKLPIFGVELGTQVLALALGARSERVPLGHYGDNLPVQDLSTKTVLMTVQNHSHILSPDSLSGALEVTHRSLFDSSVMGFEVAEKKALGVMFQLEAAPAPEDSVHPLHRFARLMG